MTKTCISQVGEDERGDTKEEEEKAFQMIKWLFSQQDLRNSFHYLNEFTRKLLLQDRIG